MWVKISYEFINLSVGVRMFIENNIVNAFLLCTHIKRVIIKYRNVISRSNLFAKIG